MQWLPLAILAAAFPAAYASDPDPSAEFERRLAPFRKLSDDIPAACKAACPSLSSLEKDMKAAEDMMPKDASNMNPKTMASSMGKVYADMFSLLCRNKDAFTCAATNSDVCGGSGGESEPDMSTAGLGAQVDCMCTKCPNLPGAMGGFLGWFMGLLTQGFAASGGGPTPAPPTQDEMMEVLCPMVNPLKCAAAQSSCAASMQDMTGGLGDLTSVTDMEPACTQGGYELEPAAAADFAAPSASAELALLGTLAAVSALVG